MDRAFSFFLFVHCLMIFSVNSENNINTDQSALLSLKSQISDPKNMLSTNWSTVTSVCSWIGVTCDSRRHRVIALNISDMGLTGTVPPQVGNLTFLVSLNMNRNVFYGNLPQEFGNLRNLQQLSMDHNQINGVIPEEIVNLNNLKNLSMDNNQISGLFRVNLFNKSSLEYLSLRNNELSGYIPREIGNFTMLKKLYLQNNTFTGLIPQEVSSLHKLKEIYLSYNSLNGSITSIPPGLFNISTLKEIGFTSNDLSGYLPLDLGNRLPNLKELKLNLNKIGGIIPPSISNASKLTVLSLRLNKFTGPIPNSLGRLENLEFLNLARNSLTVEPSSPELSLITSLRNCKYLRYLIINNNPLDSFLPGSLGNLSSSLENIYASECKIKGRIPEEIGNLSNLVLLDLSENNLIGPLPITFQECLGNVLSLREIYLNSNRLNSSLPSSLWNLKNPLTLNLSSNSFTGSIPEEVKNLEAAITIDLSSNQFTGEIPGTIGSLQNLINLTLARNGFQGSMPESIGDLIDLELLDLSNNNLSGMIPKSFEKLRQLKFLNVSSYRLRAEIPTGGPFKNFTYQSFMSNEALCGTQLHDIPPCRRSSSHGSKRKKLLLVILIPVVISSTILALAFVYIIIRRQRRNNPAHSYSSPEIAPKRIPYHQLLNAKNGFNESNLLGSGSSGSVYKASFPNSVSAAVKVFNLQSEGGFKNFDSECEVLRSLRHRNLTKVIGSCSTLEFKALVLEYMPNGSLEKWLYSDNLNLKFLQRLNIMIDVATALEYLHNGYSVPVAHCDLKPSNVLLDKDLVGHVSDFGMTKFLGEETAVHAKTLATFGYIAPEYGTEGLVSTRCDVYSYGIMLMETFTRKRPSDEMFAGDFSLRRWVKDSLPDVLHQVVDPNILKLEEKHLNEKLNCIASIMELALNCSAESTLERLKMTDVLAALTKIKLQVLTSCEGS
ncbi:probable LRR receptor-like serine threonine-kinase At3g47570 [Olea europaea subsp. europaea]|uniref:non-specific serine/threonine protein kinase n=1 Tax=Olea europaea subsp. europaea TaxID=158383 RepID=A0A8S0RDD6_OLEEU|nr:probable LRR receptor-like serine threonine-kinase At3g47570 [Olea europaea subsp. europaea]